jgi:hypothetical protein
MTKTFTTFRSERWQAIYVVLLVLFVVGGFSPAPGQAQAPEQVDPVTHPDSTTICSRPLNSYWGMIQAPADSNSAAFENRPRPTWERVAMVPYYVLGIPFRIVHLVGDRTINFLDGLGLFGLPPAEYAGLPAPFGTYLMPIMGIEGLEGVTYGMSIHRPELFGGPHEAYMVLESSTKHADRLAGGFLFKLDDVWELQIGGGRKETPLTKYYGTGFESNKADLSYYERSINWAGIELDRDIGKAFSLELRSYYSRVQASESKYEIDLALGTIHEDDLPMGYPGSSYGWTTGLSIIHDGTDQTGRPDHSGFKKAGLQYFTASDDFDLRYLTYHLNIEQFLPLWYTKRTLGLRVFYNKIDNLGTEEVPLTRMVTFQNPDELRGYESLRFYGLGSLGFSTEYRWPLWVTKNREGLGIDAYIFSDFGQVFDENDEIKFEHMSLSGGMGLRFIGAGKSYAGRVEVGFGDEGPVYRLKFSQTFQYQHKGFLHGKDPTRLH